MTNPISDPVSGPLPGPISGPISGPETAAGPRRVLLVDDDREVREALAQTLELAGFEPQIAASFVEARDHIEPAFDGVIVSDIRMPGRDGFHLLDHVRRVDPDLPVILLTGHGDVAMAVRGIAAGATAFLEKPCAPGAFVAEVRAALAARAATLATRAAKRNAQAGDAAARMLFGTSEPAQGLRDRVRTVARARGEVLIAGETGGGTPKVAEVVHLLSPAAARPFVKCSGAALTPEALAAALSQARDGTLYIDEIGTAPGATQFALLDLLDQGQSARVLAGTTRDLDAEVAAGRFSADLYWRLNVMSVRIPALHERVGDIPVLFRHYVALACEQANLAVPDIPPETEAALMARDWPGNARALMSAAMRFVLGVDDDGTADTGAAPGLAARMAEVERRFLIEALRRTGGQASDAARDLQLPRKTFYDKLTRHNLRAEDFRKDGAG